MHFRLIRLLSLSAMTLSVLGSRLPAAAKVDPTRPNIVFIIADDMQPYMFNCLPEGKGKNLTPNIDRLVSEGTLLAEQYVSAPVCTPSRYSCLTGRYASRATNAWFRQLTESEGQSVVNWNTKIVPGDVTLARLLKRAGYRTGMVGKNHAVHAPGLTKVPYAADPKDPATRRQLEDNYRTVQQSVLQAGFDYADGLYHNNPDSNGPRALASHNLDWIVQAGLDFIDHSADKPFFLYFASTVPHGPGGGERSWRADRRITSLGLLDEPVQVLPDPRTLPERLRKAGIAVTDTAANVLWLDDAVGAILDRIRDKGLADHTIVFFFNDHGQGAKGTLYQGGVRDPSIIWRQQPFPCGSVCRTRVQNIDFAPTILDLAHVASAESQFDGKSFLSALNGDPTPIHESLYFEMGFTRAVIRGNWKYLALRYPPRARNMTIAERTKILDQFNAKQREHTKQIVSTDPSAPFSHISLIPGGSDAEAASTGKYPGYYDADQLYDLAADPRERVNLAARPEHAGKLAEMKQLLSRYLQRLPGGFAELDSSQASPAER